MPTQYATFPINIQWVMCYSCDYHYITTTLVAINSEDHAIASIVMCQLTKLP
jgi:hypothetical protein